MSGIKALSAAESESAADRWCSVPETLNGLPAPVRLWLAPIREPLAVMAATSGKPVGELTMPEVMAWAMVGAYCVLSGMVLGRVAGNLAVTALRGPYRR